MEEVVKEKRPFKKTKNWQTNGFKKGHKRGNPEKAAKTRAARYSILDKIYKGEVTDPLLFLVEAMDNEENSTKDRIDCAKHALPYLYSKAPTELLAKVENTVVSVEDATESIKALLNIGETLALDIDDYEEMMYDEFDDVTSYSK